MYLSDPSRKGDMELVDENTLLWLEELAENFDSLSTASSLRELYFDYESRQDRSVEIPYHAGKALFEDPRFIPLLFKEEKVKNPLKLIEFLLSSGKAAV